MAVDPCAISAWTIESYDGKISDGLKRPGTTTLLIPEQPEKAASPMVVTLFGIAMDLNPEQPENALAGMAVTPLGTVNDRLVAEENRVPHFGSAVTEVNPEQPENAVASMDVTLAGIETDCNPEQPLNAASSMLVTLTGIAIDPSLEQL